MRIFQVYLRCKNELEQAEQQESRRQERNRSTAISAAQKKFDAACKDLAMANLLFLRHCEQHGCVIDIPHCSTES
jgi:hypothetical protein